MPNTLMLALTLLGSAVMSAPDGSSRTLSTATAHTTGQALLQRKGIVPINHAKPIHARRKSKHAKAQHAEAKITVQNSESKPLDQSATPALMEIHLDETFTGDIEGESPVRALQVLHEDHSASLVSVQRFKGKLGGRQGTFVLQGTETVENGKIKAKWFVIPGSGTDELAGLRGEGGFEGDFGKGSNGTLDYWFE